MTVVLILAVGLLVMVVIRLYDTVAQAVLRRRARNSRKGKS
ncbi:hypothetical protein [Kitasatospora sp. CB01950]|nr:hypothetical protein [Kitasatospora sp. CB01950]